MTAARVIRLPRLPKSLTVNALALMTATIGANGLGLVFWVVAAHLQPPEVVGQASALVAALTLLAMIAELNLTNVIVRLLPAAGRLGTYLVGRAYLAHLPILFETAMGAVWCWVLPALAAAVIASKQLVAELAQRRDVGAARARGEP
jgi:O-antigen/teichoic acid export membrane protein